MVGTAPTRGPSRRDTVHPHYRPRSLPQPPELHLSSAHLPTLGGPRVEPSPVPACPQPFLPFYPLSSKQVPGPALLITHGQEWAVPPPTPTAPKPKPASLGGEMPSVVSSWSGPSPTPPRTSALPQPLGLELPTPLPQPPPPLPPLLEPLQLPVSRDQLPSALPPLTVCQGGCAHWGRGGLLVTRQPSEAEHVSLASGDGLQTLHVRLKGL